jgi:prepilin-type N-terminal cleavage/methylation domain-containing protein
LKVKGFTLIEIITVLAIVAILWAITMPVYAKASRAAKEQSNTQRLKQISLAVSIYRTENEGDGKYGTASQMGIHPLTPAIPRFRKLFAPPYPCGRRGIADFMFWPTEQGIGEGLEPWQTVSVVYEEQTPLVSTTNCSPADSNVDNVYHVKVGHAVQLDGGLIKRISTGDDAYVAWWKR